jgi:hypothetical protein
MQKAGLNVLWEEAARQAEFFRVRAQRWRKEIEAEAARNCA